MQGFRKHFWLIGAAAVYLILAVVRIVGINSRSELHADEVYSLMLARCNPAYFAPLPADTVFTGAEIKAQLVVNHPLGQDLAQLYLNNGDAPHASLYYMALRLALCGMDGFDAHELAVRGGLLNLIFWTVAFWAMWSLCRSLFGRIRYGDVIVLATLIIAFGIPLSLRCTMLVREYQMAEMFVILFSLTSACICRYVMARRCVPTRLWCFLALAVAGVISTGYLNSIYVFC